MQRTGKQQAERNPGVRHLLNIAQSISQVLVNDELRQVKTGVSVVRRFVAWQALGNRYLSSCIEGPRAKRYRFHPESWLMV